MVKGIGILLLLLMLCACGEEKAPDKAPTLTPTATAEPDLAVEDRVLVETQYEQLRQLHTQMQAVWETLATGENVQCGENYEVLSPSMVTQVDLRRAAIELEDAVNLWQAECENPRNQIPTEVINRGVLMVRSAGDALLLVEQLLKE